MAATMRAVARSAKFANFLANRAVFSLNRRTYLSAQYSCEKEWDESKKKDPLLKDVDTERLFVDVMKRMGNKSESGIALDVDIFVNTLESEKVLDELSNTLNRFRRSKYCSAVLPSTVPAVVRYCLKNGLEDKLISFFEDRLNYGIFPDTQTLNFMLDHFLTRQMYRNAAKVAVHFALQEDLGNEISKTLSLIACARYLSSGKNAAPWTEEVVIEKAEEDDDDEIEYVRVPNITNPWFDDHFDLNDPNDLIGKALLFFGRASEGVVRDSAILIGLARRQRWDELKNTLASVIEVSKDTKDLCLERLGKSAPAAAEADEGNAQKAGDEAASDSAPESEQASTNAAPVENAIPDWVEGALSKIKTNSATLLELLEKDVKKLNSVEEADIKILRENIAAFSERRKTELDESNWQIERQKRFEILKKKKIELVQKEELLYAFENWNKIEILLKEVIEERGEVEEAEKEYIPAQINRRHREGAAKIQAEQL